MELAARKWSQYILIKGQEPRRWYGTSKEQLEESLMIAAGTLPCHVVTICHVDEDKDDAGGFIVRNPNLPGKMRKSASAAYGEFYHSYVSLDAASGNITYCLQTKHNGLFNAGSQILAPDGCPPDYQALWASREQGAGSKREK